MPSYISHGNGVTVIGGQVTIEGAVHIAPVIRCEVACKAGCTEEDRPWSIAALPYGAMQASWIFTWHPIQHGYGACASCGYWHKIYFYDEDHRPIDKMPELVDTRGTHTPGYRRDNAGKFA